jgi:L-fuconate dehydratase
MALARKTVGPDIRIAVDANQRWGVAQAAVAIAALAPWHPYWVEEPTSPDEILGLAAIKSAINPAAEPAIKSSAEPAAESPSAPIKIAVGEHVANRVIFKQILQAGGADVLTIDACRVAGVNENLAILLLAAKYGVPVCPHAGGVGLCEMVQHLAMYDFVGVAASAEDRVLEYVDHLHEHFTDPVRVVDGRYLAPTTAGFSTTLRPESLRDYEFPHGAVWRRLGGE